MTEGEAAESGERIVRHGEREKVFEPAFGDPHAIEKIANHIEKHIGKVETTFHELVSDLVHVDVHHVPPTSERNFHVLVTSGMSDLAMSAPDGMEDCRYAELMVCLPSDWRLSYEEFREEENYWPVRWLKRLARFPHEYDTWLWFGHTVPNGNPPEPFAPNTRLCCMMLVPPLFPSEDFKVLEVGDDKTIHFFGLVPLYREEMELKLKKGAWKLLERFAERRISEVLDPDRQNVCRRRSLWRWLDRLTGRRRKD